MRVRHLLIGALGLLAAVVPPAIAVPVDPAPWQASERMPPPAWVETSHGDRWLASAGSSCWFDPPLATPPPCAAPIPVSVLALMPAPPEIPVDVGEVVRFHLGLAPDSLTLRGTGPTALPATDPAAWTVTPDAGRMALDVFTRNGFFTYQVNLAVSERISGGPDPGPPDGTSTPPVPPAPPHSTGIECRAWNGRVLQLTRRMRHERTLAGRTPLTRRHPLTLVLRRQAGSRAGYIALLRAGCE